MERDSTTSETADTTLFASEAWFDPIEAGVRTRVREFISEVVDQELTAALGHDPHEQVSIASKRYGHGKPGRRLADSLGLIDMKALRARLAAQHRGTQGSGSAALPHNAQTTRQIEALIAGAYLAGTNARRVKRTMSALFSGTMSEEAVSRTWRNVRTDWEAWSKRDLAGEDIVRLILDGAVVRVRTRPQGNQPIAADRARRAA